MPFIALGSGIHPLTTSSNSRLPTWNLRRSSINTCGTNMKEPVSSTLTCWCKNGHSNHCLPTTAGLSSGKCSFPYSTHMQRGAALHFPIPLSRASSDWPYLEMTGTGPSWVNTSSANQSPPLWSCSWDLSLSLPLVAKLGEVWHESSWCFYIRSGNIKLTFIFPDLMYIICKYINIYISIMYIICKYIYISVVRNWEIETMRREGEIVRMAEFETWCQVVLRSHLHSFPYIPSPTSWV